MFSLINIKSFVSIVALLNLKAVLAFNQCYYPDGSIPTDFLWEPCTGSKYSACCVPSEGDICQPDGLCFYPLANMTYRGTCTDRTWNDPSCNVGTCVSGFETTWQWALECDSGASASVTCGEYSGGSHTTPSCKSGQASKTAYQTSVSTTSAGRYTPPPSVDTARFSVQTDTYTTIITALAQTTTKTSTFMSTFTSTLSPSGSSSTASAKVSGSAVPANGTDGANNNTSTANGKVVLTTGVLVAIIAGPLLAIAICIGVFFFVRRKRASQRATRIDSGNYPPANGPVGADQVHPYEVGVNEATKPPQAHSYYKGPYADTHEMDDRSAILGEKKSPAAAEMGAYEARSPVSAMSPAPTYAEALMPVELDGTSSLRTPSRG